MELIIMKKLLLIFIATLSMVQITLSTFSGIPSRLPETPLERETKKQKEAVEEELRILTVNMLELTKDDSKEVKQLAKLKIQQWTVDLRKAGKVDQTKLLTRADMEALRKTFIKREQAGEFVLPFAAFQQKILDECKRK